MQVQLLLPLPLLCAEAFSGDGAAPDLFCNGPLSRGETFQTHSKIANRISAAIN
jgi:hypothetical protein